LKAARPPAVWEANAVTEDEEAVAFLISPFVCTGFDARLDLWEKLRSGELPAEGIPIGEKKRVNIPAPDWADLDWLTEPSASAQSVGIRESNIVRYDDVSVPALRALEIWLPLRDLPSKEYAKEEWTTEHAILWIAYRDPSLFHFVGHQNRRFRAAVAHARTFGLNPKDALLRELQSGGIRAIRNGAEIAPEQWFGKRIPGRQAESKRIYFRRTDILRKWEPTPLNSDGELVA
jgi:hypothetical protein